MIDSCIVVNKLYFNWCSRTLQRLAAEQNVEFASVFVSILSFIFFFFFFAKAKLTIPAE